MTDPMYRLRIAIANGEHCKLAQHQRIAQSARRYRPSWGEDDVYQEIACYLLHLQTNTKSGWDPARGKWSTWATLAMRGWLAKLKRATRPDDAPNPNPEGVEPATHDDPESLLSAEETRKYDLLAPIMAIFG